MAASSSTVAVANRHERERSASAGLDEKEHPSTKIKRATRAPIGGASQVRGIAAARALPDTVVAQLHDDPALGLLKRMHGDWVRLAIEVLADTGRPRTRSASWRGTAWTTTPRLTTTAPARSSRFSSTTCRRSRIGCRLPIDYATAQLIITQKYRVRERYPDTPPYAFRHSYAQRHADHGTPVEVLRELMGHASMVTTQGYFHVRDERARKAVQTLAPLQIDRHAAVDARLAAGNELTIAAIARHAGVSRKFIYAHPDLRAQIEQRALQARAHHVGRGR